MSHAMRICVIAGIAVAALTARPGAASEDIALPAAEPKIRLAPDPLALGAATPRGNPLGVKPIDPKRLQSGRGGTDVFNEMQLKGVVADNRAINVSTGNNTIADGAFAASGGVPMVVQNTGNNVLIQNATIISVQVK